MSVCAVGGCWSFQEAKEGVLWIKLNGIALGWCCCIKPAFNGLILAINICHDLRTFTPSGICLMHAKFTHL